MYDKLNYEIPRVLVGAIQGRSGKTTFTLGLLKALTDRGLRVQPFKKGPDYIDPSWMTFASGQQCRNLDLFMMGADKVCQSFIKNSQGIRLCKSFDAFFFYSIFRYIYVICD